MQNSALEGIGRGANNAKADVARGRRGRGADDVRPRLKIFSLLWYPREKFGGMFFRKSVHPATLHTQRGDMLKYL